MEVYSEVGNHKHVFGQQHIIMISFCGVYIDIMGQTMNTGHIYNIPMITLYYSRRNVSFTILM